MSASISRGLFQCFVSYINMYLVFIPSIFNALDSPLFAKFAAIAMVLPLGCGTMINLR